MSSTRPEPRLLHTAAIILRSRLDLVEWPRLRTLFSDLFDDCARAVSSQRLDLDDVVMDRFLLIRVGRGPIKRIAAQWSSRLGHAIDIARSLNVSNPSTLELQGLGVEVLQVDDYARFHG